MINPLDRFRARFIPCVTFIAFHAFFLFLSYFHLHDIFPTIIPLPSVYLDHTFRIESHFRKLEID